MKIAGVVVWYNPTNEDIKNIDTYLNSLDKLYIVDNSNKSNNYNGSKVEYIFNNENIGIAAALNIAAKKAIKENYEWLLTMDQDTKMNNESFKEFEKIVNTMSTAKIGIITPWHETKLDTKKPQEKYTYPLEVMTSGNFVNLSILKKLNYFDEKLFIDGVDIEYGLRLKKHGYKILQFNNVSIKHNLGNIEYHKFLGKTFMCTNHNYIRQYYMARNYRYIRDLYLDLEPEYCNILVKIKGNIFKITMFEKDKFRKLKYMFKGIKDYKRKKIGRIDEV